MHSKGGMHVFLSCMHRLKGGTQSVSKCAFAPGMPAATKVKVRMTAECMHDRSACSIEEKACFYLWNALVTGGHAAVCSRHAFQVGMHAGLCGALTAAIRMQARLHRTGTARWGAEQRAGCPEGAPDAALPRAWGGRPKLRVGEPAGAHSEQHCIFTGAGTISVLARLDIKRHWCQFRTA